MAAPMYPRCNTKYDKKSSQTRQTKYKKRIKNVPGQFSSLLTLSFFFSFPFIFSLISQFSNYFVISNRLAELHPRTTVIP